MLPLVVVLTLIGSSLSVLVAVVVSPHAGSRYVARYWARSVAWVIPIVVRVKGAENARPGQSYIVVCNHQSQIDILTVYGWLDLDLKWVIKKELRKVPGIGIGCEKVGHIFVDRKNPEKARASINAALKRLGDGIGILFFPEGTRSDDGRLLPFKKGAFRVAIDQQLPVLPVTLNGTRDILPARTLKLFPGATSMRIHPEIPTRGKSLDDLKQIMTSAQEAIAAGLDRGD